MDDVRIFEPVKRSPIRILVSVLVLVVLLTGCGFTLWADSYGFPSNRWPQLGRALMRNMSSTVYWMRTCGEHSWPSSYEVLREPLQLVGDKYVHDGYRPDEMRAVGLGGRWSPVRAEMLSGFDAEHRLDIWVSVDCTTFPEGN